jgi:SAM-dependent methyltransferase
VPDRRYWDAVHETWRTVRPHALWRRHSDAVDTAWLEALLPAERVPRLLKTDLFNEGISPGLYPVLAKAAESVVGIDISIATTHAAQARYGALQTVAADVRQLPFADGSFDVIVSNSTLDHFEMPADIVTSLAELRRVLSVGGHLLVSLDNLANPFIAVRNGASMAALRLGVVPYFVGATFGPRRLRRALMESGFQIVSATSVMHCPRVIAVAACAMVERFASAVAASRFLAVLRWFERFARLPTRYLTGHFVVAKACKRGERA